MSQDTKPLSNRELLKAYLLDGNMANWIIAEEPVSPFKQFYTRSLPQRIFEIDKELQEAGIGYIEATKEYHPRRTEYRFKKYTNEDRTSEDT